jgi:hypothetical protein
VFQLTYTIAIIQKYYKMMHNDFHYGNILIDNSIEPKGYFVYEINNKKFYIKNTGIIPKLWDFEFCMVYSDKIKDCYPNKYIIGSYNYDKKKHMTIVDDSDDEDDNVPYNYNEVYDLHYFLTSLLDLYISQELFDWILSIYPNEVIPEEEDSSSESESGYNSSSRSSSSRSSRSTSLSSELEKLSINESKTDSDSDSDSDVESDSDSDYTSSDSSNSDSTSDSDSSNFSSESNKNNYINDGRLVNGTENIFDLPTPVKIMDHDFFACFTKKPDDFKESEAIYFKAGF